MTPAAQAPDDVAAPVAASPSLRTTSVIVVVRGRHDHLRRTLAAVLSGDPLPEEVVIVAMADDEIAALADDVAGRIPVRGPAAPVPSIRVVPLDCDPRRLPLARARNLGARTALGDDLVFLDVDCIPDPGLVGAYADALARLGAATKRRPLVCAGPVTYLAADWLDRVRPDAAATTPGTDLVDPVALRTLRSPHGARPDPAPGELLEADDPDLFWSLSFAVTAHALQSVGGFDEAYEGYGGEDTDFARRLVRAGGELWWVGGADAYHQHHPVSRPPVEHVDDILRNVELFEQRWGEPCMSGWVDAFEELGIVVRDASGRSRRVVHVVGGPDAHGITRHALDLLAHGRAEVLRVDAEDDPADRLSSILTGRHPGVALHLHLNDVLLGPRTVDIVEHVARHAQTTLTLHDLPDPREGRERYARRCAGYAAMWQASAGVVVSSDHEAGLLRATVGDAGGRPEGMPPISVVPLPLRQPEARTLDPAGRTPFEPVVGVLGYLYPGKGHDVAITVAAAAGLRGVVALGAISPGHEAEGAALAERAARLGLTWEVTGFLPDDELMHRAREVAVPLAWHAHVSASGSIGTWVEAGRRPMVADGGWVRELAARCPGAVTVVPGEEQLPVAVTAALADPASTFVAPQVSLRPTAGEAWAATAAAIRAAHRAWSGTAS